MVALQQNGIWVHGSTLPGQMLWQSDPIKWYLCGPGMMILFHRNGSLYWDAGRADFDQLVCIHQLRAFSAYSCHAIIIPVGVIQTVHLASQSNGLEGK